MIAGVSLSLSLSGSAIFGGSLGGCFAVGVLSFGIENVGWLQKREKEEKK